MNIHKKPCTHAFSGEASGAKNFTISPIAITQATIFTDVVLRGGGRKLWSFVASMNVCISATANSYIEKLGRVPETGQSGPGPPPGPKIFF